MDDAFSKMWNIGFDDNVVEVSNSLIQYRLFSKSLLRYPLGTSVKSLGGSIAGKEQSFSYRET